MNQEMLIKKVEVRKISDRPCSAYKELFNV